MKEFVCRDTCQVFIRIGADRGRVRVFHATATSPFANVEDEHVAFEGSSSHELQFVLADALQVRLDLLFPPVVPMNHDPNFRLHPRQLKLFELPCLDGRVDKGIVARGITTEDPDPARGFNELNRRTGRLPIYRNVWHRKMYGLATPLCHVHEDHRRIDASIFWVEWRGKGPRLIPVSAVRDFDCSRTLDMPRLLVHLVDEYSPRICKRLHLLHVTAEVTNLVERIPCRHPHNPFASHIWNAHRYVEEMPRGMI